MDNARLGDVQSLLQGAGDLAEKAVTEWAPDDGTGAVALVTTPGNWNVAVLEELEQYRQHPRRKTGALTVTDVQSFVEYVKRHESDATIVEVDPAGVFRATLNHHAPALAGDTPADGAAGWRDHTATLKRPYSRAYRAWRSFMGEWRAQEALAEFLEDRRLEIVNGADQATLVEIAEYLDATKAENVGAFQRLADGSVRVSYENTVTSTRGRSGDVVIPTEFEVALPLYEGGSSIRFGVRLRWRVADRRPVFLLRAADSLEDEIEHELDAAIAGIDAALGSPMFRVASL